MPLIDRSDFATTVERAYSAAGKKRNTMEVMRKIILMVSFRFDDRDKQHCALSSMKRIPLYLMVFLMHVVYNISHNLLCCLR